MIDRTNQPPAAGNDKHDQKEYDNSKDQTISIQTSLFASGDDGNFRAVHHHLQLITIVIQWVMGEIVLESFHAFGVSHVWNSAHKIPKYTCTS